MCACACVCRFLRVCARARVPIRAARLHASDARALIPTPSPPAQTILAQGKRVLARESQRRSGALHLANERRGCCSVCCAPDAESAHVDDLETGSVQAPLMGDATAAGAPVAPRVDTEIDALVVDSADGDDFAPDTCSGWVVRVVSRKHMLFPAVKELKQRYGDKYAAEVSA